MNQHPEHSQAVIGPAALIAALATGYQCGHCPSETTLRTDDHGLLHLVVAHDDDCPVLAGHLSAAPDTIRAATSRP